MKINRKTGLISTQFIFKSASILSAEKKDLNDYFNWEEGEEEEDIYNEQKEKRKDGSVGSS